MKKALRLLTVIACLICGMTVDARVCGSCHGNGYRRVSVGGVGNYGVGGRSSNNQYAICSTCGGSGEIGRSNGGGGGMLYPAEAQSVQTLLEMLNYGEAYYPDCTVCNGSGACPNCQGASRYSYYDWDTGLTYGGCIPCGSSGICPTCKGGRKGPKQYRPISDQQRTQCLEMLRSILQNAAKRTRR